MSGTTTDSWTRTITVQAGEHTVVITEEGDGVNEPELSATVDGRPTLLTATDSVLIDGIEPHLSTEMVDADGASVRVEDIYES